MKKAILFDLDGTLLDTLQDLHNSVNHALESMGYPKRSLEEVRRFVGNGAKLLMERAVPENGDAAEALARFRAHYDANCRALTKPYEGIPEALAELSGEYRIAIVSNKPDPAVKALCADFFPGIYALGERADCPRKPAQDMVKKAMAAIGAESCVYVGDSEVDVLTAQNAGVPCLSVLWGFRDKEDMTAVGGNHFCEHPAELAREVRKLI